MTESELFRKLNVLLLDSNKEHLEDIKEKASLMANVEIDNSGLIRGVIEYFFEHPGQIKKLIPYIKDMKGYSIVARFNQMLHENRTLGEIEKELGIGVDIITEVQKRYGGDTSPEVASTLGEEGMEE